jgi:hypothetical protein
MDRAAIPGEDVLLDVGTDDGLIGLAALNISTELDACPAPRRQPRTGLLDRCRFRTTIRCCCPSRA